MFRFESTLVWGVCAVLATTAGAQGSLSLVSGDNQTATRVGTNSQGGEALYAPLSVLVKDATGKPLAGVPVVFSQGVKPAAMACQFDPSGDASSTAISDATGLATLRKMSNAAGAYSARIYYADGQCQIVATLGTSTVTFHLNAAAPSITIASGDNQTATRLGTNSVGGEAIFAPLSVLVTDAAGKPLAGVPVLFSQGVKPAAMACQFDPSGDASSTAISDAAGLATLRKMSNAAGAYSARIYYADGQCQILATLGTSTVTFHLNATTK